MERTYKTIRRCSESLLNVLHVAIYVLCPRSTKMWFSIKDFFSKCDQIRRKLRIWSHLLKKSLIENLIFCAVDFDLNASLGRYLKAPTGLLFIEHFKHNWEGTAQNIKILSILNSCPYPFIKVSFVNDIFSCLLTLFFEKWFWKNNSNNNC